MPHSKKSPTRTRHGITAVVMPDINHVVHFIVGDTTVGHGHPEFHDLKGRYHAPDAPEDAVVHAAPPPHRGPSGF